MWPPPRPASTWMQCGDGRGDQGDGPADRGDGGLGCCEAGRLCQRARRQPLHGRRLSRHRRAGMRDQRGRQRARSGQVRPGEGQGGRLRDRLGDDQKNRLQDHPHGRSWWPRRRPAGWTSLRHRRPVPGADAGRRRQRGAHPGGHGPGKCGAPGTTAALALLNDAVKKGGAMASSYVGGLSGAFIPVSEDAGMIEAVEQGRPDPRKAGGHDLRLLRGPGHDRRARQTPAPAPSPPSSPTRRPSA